MRACVLACVPLRRCLFLITSRFLPSFALIRFSVGIFCGVSSGGAVSAALRLAAEVRDAVIVVIVCDRGDRYLSTGVFPA